MHRIFVLILILMWAFTPISRAQDFSYLQGLNDPAYHKLESEILKRPFHLYVRLPDNYSDSDEHYPTIYLLDGGHTFPMLAAYTQYLRFAEEIPPVIIIGISYGDDDFRAGNHRSTDFTAPSKERAHYGGAETFQSVLATEIIPLIETTYLADAERRVIWGQSLGGQFVLFTALTQPDLFWGHIASNPALHRNLDLFLALEPSATTGDSKLFVSLSSDDEPRFLGPAQAWLAAWTGREAAPWTLGHAVLDGEGHFSAAPRAFRDGLRFLFAGP